MISDRDPAELERTIAAAERALRTLGEALAADGRSPDASAVAAIDQARAALDRARRDAPRDAAAGSTLFFDVSDLFGYFPTNRLPTGIQRVQIEIISRFLDGGEQGVGLCRFLEDRAAWVEVPADLFVELCAASKAGGDATAPDWLALFARAQAASRAAPEPGFGPGATLINLGTSWWLPNYFLYIRELKSRHGIRYVPLIYDMIPALFPGYCNPELVEEFIGWLTGVLRHADYYLAISEASKADLIRLAGQIGIDVPADSVGVVPLDADFRKASGVTPVAPAGPRGLRTYVLFVSTIEARKNQLGALAAWQALIAAHGLDRVPQLILVGKSGFHHQQVRDRIAASGDLAARVTVLAGVDDPTLAALYRDALFTIYPSFYEGWGLPVTESLCYGRVPLVARNSSLPEAGGTFAEYYESGSTAAFVAGLERLIFDHAHRAAAERRIREGFAPRNWSAVGAQVADHIRAWRQRIDLAAPSWTVPPVVAGSYYPMVRNRSKSLWPGMGTADIFRTGTGWWQMEDWGSWTRAGGGSLQFAVADAGAIRIALELFGNPHESGDFEVWRGDRLLRRGPLDRERRKWVSVDLDVTAGEIVTLQLQAGSWARGSGPDQRDLGIGLCGFFVMDREEPGAELRFVEAVALGAMRDYDHFRRARGARDMG